MQHTLVVSALYQDVSGQNISAMAEALVSFDYTGLLSDENVAQEAVEASQMAASSRTQR